MTQLWGTAISNTPAARWKLRTRRIHRLPGLLSAYDRKCVKNYNKRAEQRGFPYAQRGIGSVAIAGTFATTSSSHASLLPVDQSGSDSDMMKGMKGPTSNSRDSQASVSFIIGSSIVSSVVLICVNKHLMAQYDFKYIFTLTGLHFLFGGFALTVMSYFFHSFEIKYLKFNQNLLVAASGVSSICFMNFSLQANSVGTYQLLKLLVIPLVIAMQRYFDQTADLSRRVIASLVTLLGGVGLSTVTDVSLTTWGLLIGILSVVCTAQFNIWQGSKQREHSLTSVQLLHSISFAQALLCFVLGLYFDILTAKVPLFAHKFDPREIGLILVSCVFAMVVNLSSMGIIGKTSAVTYQVVGHAKTCLILISGYVMFPPADPDVMTLVKNILGVVIALLGVFAYTYLKLNNM